jgi:hypothetical protein
MGWEEQEHMDPNELKTGRAPPISTLCPKLQRKLTFACAPYAVLLAYSNVYHNDFVFDDLALIVLNEFLRQWGNLPDILKLNGGTSEAGRAFYRPLPMTIYFLMYQAFGLSTVAFHALNVVLQAINAGPYMSAGPRPWHTSGGFLFGGASWAVHTLWTDHRKTLRKNGFSCIVTEHWRSNSRLTITHVNRRRAEVYKCG